MATASTPGEQLDQLDSLLTRWQTSLDLHARYAALDEERYWHVQPWPRHERPQRWIIQLARKRIIALRRIVEQRQAEGDRAFIEGIEIMGFLATLVGVTTMERFIPLATPETERRDVLAEKAAPAPKAAAESTRARAIGSARERAAPPERAPETTSRTAENRRVVEAATRGGVERRRTAETTRQMPVLQSARNLAAQRAAVQARAGAPAPAKEVRRDPTRPATIKPKKAPSTITAAEHVVIADAVRLLGWGKQWHEIGDMIGRLAERPGTAEIRRILKTYREHIEAVATRRGR
jgi:hypothetical protein